MYFVSINAGAQVVIILLACGPCVVIVNCLGQVLYLGRAPRTKETLPDFREQCRVIRHPRLFRRLAGCQRDPRVLGRHTHKRMNLISLQILGVYSVVCIGFHRHVFMGTGVLGNSYDKAYLIKKKYQFKSRLSVYCITRVL